MLTQQYTIEDPIDSTPPYTLDGSPLATVLNDTAVDRRATEAHFGMGDKSPGKEVLSSAIRAGEEPSYRQSYANVRDGEMKQIQLDTVSKIASASTKPMTEAEQAMVMMASQYQPTDPSTAWESSFSRNYTSMAAYRNTELWRTAWDDIPEPTQRVLQIANNNITKQRAAQTLYEDMEARWNTLNIAQKTGYFALGFLGFTSSWQENAVMNAKLKGDDSVTGAAWEGVKTILPGSNLGEKMDNLWSIRDPSQFRETLSAAAETLYRGGNPLAAFHLVEAARGYGTTDRFIDNTWGLANLSTNVGTGILTRAGMRWLGFGSKTPVGGVIRTPDQIAKDAGPAIQAATKAAETTPVDKQIEMFARQTQGELFEGVNLGTQPEQQLRGLRNAKGQVLKELKPGEVKEPSSDIFPYKDPFTGRYQRTYGKPEQAELPLNTPAHQLSFDFSTGTMARVQKSVEGDKISVPQSLAAVGDVEAAATVEATQILKARIRSLDPLEEGKDLFDKIQSFYNPRPWFFNPNSLHRDKAARLADAAEARSIEMQAALVDKTRVPMLNDAAEAKAVSEAVNRARVEFQPNHEHIIDIVNNGWKPADNTLSVSVLMGKADKRFFDTPNEASNYAIHNLGIQPGDFFPDNYGGGYVINVPRSARQDLDVVRKLNIPVNKPDGRSFLEMTLPEKFYDIKETLKTLVTPIRSAPYILPKFQMGQRGVTTHAMQSLRNEFAKQAKDLKKSVGRSYDDLNRMLTYNNTMPNPKNPETPGYFFESLGELEMEWQKMFGRQIKPHEANAYFHTIQLNDWDMAMRELGWHSTKSRMGFMNFRFEALPGPHTTIDQATGKVERTLPAKSDWFEGRTIDDIDWGFPGNEGIWFVDSSGKGAFHWKNAIRNTAVATGIKDSMENAGHKIVELFSPYRGKLEGFTGDGRPITYVISPNFEDKRLVWGQHSDYNPGGHQIYQYPFFGKQPIVNTGIDGQMTYYGDFTFRNYKTEAEAQYWMHKYDTARLLLKAGDDAVTSAFLKVNLPLSLDEWKKSFGPGKLSMDHPMGVTSTGRDFFESNPRWLLEDAQYKDLKNQLNSPRNYEQQLDRTFLADRGRRLQTDRKLGSEENPLFKLEDAKLIDPFPAMQRSLGNAMRSRYMGDYKISAAEQWVQQYGNLLTQTMDRSLKNPIYALYHGEFKEGLINSLVGDTRAQYLAAKTSRASIMSFIGVQSETSGTVKYIEQKMMNMLPDKGVEWVYAHPTVLTTIKDPAAAARAVTFHAILGNFSPVQLIVQPMALIHMMGVAGLRPFLKGVGGSIISDNAAAYLAGRQSRRDMLDFVEKSFSGGVIARQASLYEDEKVINFFAKVSRAFGWDPEDWKLANQAMKNNGFHIVGGDTAWKDDLSDPKIYKGLVGGFLDKGQIFFKEGEGINRTVGWFTAFTEWRKLNPGKELTDLEVSKILDRALILNQDMTRSAKAAWESGEGLIGSIGSVASQFSNFSIRLSEQMLGNRLTPVEKARAMFAYSLVFGIPTGIAVRGGYIWAGDLYSDIRKYAIENGYNVNDTTFQALNDGLLSLMLHMTMDEVSPTRQTSKGTEEPREPYNVAKRYGPAANASLVEKVLKGDKPPMELLTGPTGSVLGGMAKATMPFLRLLRYGVLGNGDEEFPITHEDFMSAAGVLSSASMAVRVGAMLNTGKYYTKNEMYLGDADKLDAIMNVLGLTRQNLDDAFLIKDIEKDWKKGQENGIHEVSKVMRRGIEAANRGEDKEAKKHFAQAKALKVSYDLNIESQDRAWKEAIKGLESFVDKVNSDFGPLSKHLPISVQQRRMEELLKK